MDMSKITIGENPPFDINVIIEVPLGGQPIKYELEKESGAMFVDRFSQQPCTTLVITVTFHKRCQMMATLRMYLFLPHFH